MTSWMIDGIGKEDCEINKEVIREAVSPCVVPPVEEGARQERMPGCESHPPTTVSPAR